MSRNKSLTFPLILSVIALIAWVGATFLGFIYSTQGNIFLSGLFSLAVLVFMGLGLFLLIWSAETTNIRRGQKRVIRIISWILYLSGTVVSFYYLNHNIKVMAQLKETVRTEVMETVEDFKVAYCDNDERPQFDKSFAKYIKNQVNNFSNKLKGEGENVEDIKAIASKLKDKLKKTPVDSLDSQSSFNATKKDIEAKIEQIEKGCINSWNPFSVYETLKDFSRDRDRWENLLGEFYKVDDYTSKVPYEYTFKEAKDSFEKLKDTDFGIAWQSIVVAIILQILLLLPVLMTIDWSKGERRANVSTI